MPHWYSYGFGQYRANEFHVFAASRLFKPDATKLPILVCPAHGQTAPNAVLTGWIGDVVNALAEAGYPIFAGDMGGGINWANAASSTAVGQARSYAASAYGAKSGNVGLLGTSMGAATALRYVMDNPANVSCFVGGVPAVDIRDIHDVTRPDLAAEIETANGGAGGYATYLSTYNPIDHASSFTSLPMQLHYSTNDPSITPSTVTSFGAGAGAELTSLGAVGHSPAGMDPVKVVNFFNAHL